MKPRLCVALLATVVEFGGIERVLLNLVRHMDPDVELVPILFKPATADQRVLLDQLDGLGMAYEAFDVDTSRFKYLNPVRNIREALSRVRAGRFDVIHTHGYRADLIGLVASVVCRLPVVATCHGYIAKDRQLGFYNALDIFLLRFFSGVIAVSESMKHELVVRGVPDKRVRVITNAVSEVPASRSSEARTGRRRQWGIGDDEFVFGFVGRLSEEKGLTHLLEAVRSWTGSVEKWRLILIGDGAQRGELEDAVRDAGLDERVVFAGFQNEPSVWYPVMDAFVLPSLTEGTPMALLEAMAAGIPVVATAVGGVPAIIESGVSGMLVPPADPPALLAAMRSVCGDRALRERLSDNAKRIVSRDFDLATWIGKTTDLYRSVSRSGRQA